MATTDTAEPALQLVPDFSGFTKFAQMTEFTHSHHFIEELEVSEVKGDAILICRFGKAPTARRFFQRMRKMFINLRLAMGRDYSQGLGSP